MYGVRSLFDTIATLAGRMFTFSTGKTLGSNGMTSAINGALNGVEKGALTYVDHVVQNVRRELKINTSQYQTC